MQTRIKGGATIWARQTIESEIFLYKPDKWFKIWFYIVNRAYFKEKNEFERGECFLKYSWIKEATGATKDQIYVCVKWLKRKGMLTTNKTTRGMHIKVLNYDKYQNLDNYKNDAENDIKTIKTRPINDTILKNDKNVKKDKNDNTAGKPADNKNTNLNTSNTPEKKQSSVQENKQITEIIDIFRKTNKAIEFGNKTERKDSLQLIEEYGFQEAVKWAKFAVEVQDNTVQENKYAPRITTPHFLWKKLTTLKIHFNKLNKKSYDKPTNKERSKYAQLSKKSYN